MIGINNAVGRNFSGYSSISFSNGYLAITRFMDIEKGTIKIVSNTLQNNSSVAVTARGYGNFGQGGDQWVTKTCPANTTTTVISGGSLMVVCYVEGPDTYSHTRTWGSYSGTSQAFTDTKTVYEEELVTTYMASHTMTSDESGV